MTPLHVACENTKISHEIIQVLIENKAEPNVKDTNNKIALHFASSNLKISPKIIKILIESKSDLNCKGGYFQDSPFHRACSNQRVTLEVVKYFVDHGADLYSIGYLCSPSQYLSKNHFFNYKLLKEFGKDYSLENILKNLSSYVPSNQEESEEEGYLSKKSKRDDDSDEN